jgi:hypothetical protein
MLPRDYPHHDYPNLDYPCLDLYDSGASQVQGRKARSISPAGGRSTSGTAWSPLGILAAGILYSPFWLAGLTLSQTLLPGRTLNAESSLDFCLFSGFAFGLFLYTRSTYRRLKKKRSPLWIPFFILAFLLICGLPGWFLFEYGSPILHKLGLPASYTLIPAAALAWILFNYHRLLPRH